MPIVPGNLASAIGAPRAVRFALLAAAMFAVSLVRPASRAQVVVDQFPSTDGSAVAFPEAGNTISVGGVRESRRVLVIP